MEAVARRRRRVEVDDGQTPTWIGELLPEQYQAFVNGSSLQLTRREFELIRLLSEAEGRVLPREEIYEHVWGYAMARGDRSVDVFVRKLRAKLERASPDWQYIHTHFGVGYRLAAQRASPGQSPGRPVKRAIVAAGHARV